MSNIEWSAFGSAGNAQVGDNSVGLRSGTNYRFTFPGTGINDSNGNKLVYWSSVPAAVNYVTLTNAATGTGALVSSTGGDASPNLILGTAGSGNILFTPGGTGNIQCSTHLILSTSSPSTALEAASKGYVDSATPSYPITLSQGGTNASLSASAGGIFYSGASAGAILAGTSTANQIILSGNLSAPTWSTATYPATTTINQILYSSSNNVIAGVTAGNSGVLITGVTGIPSISSTLPSAVQANITTVGTVASGSWNANVIQGQYGGTGATNTGKTITLGGSLTTSGAFDSTFTMTATTGVTFPTSGTLATTSQIPSFPLSLANGGTNAALTASNGGIFYSTASAGAILSGTGTANQLLMSGSSTSPAWSTATYPATTTAGQLVYSSATNTVGGLTSANSAALVTNTTGIPSWSATMTNGQLIIGATGGTPAPGTLTAGTGVTITNGAGSITINATGSVPLSFATDSGTATPSANSITVTGGTIGLTTTGSGSTISVTGTLILANGGTGAALTASTGGIVYSGASAMAILAGVGTAGCMLRSGNSAAPTWSTATWPSTTTANQLLYSSATSTVGGLTGANNGVLITSNSGVPSWLANGTAGQVLIAQSSAPPAWTTYGIALGSTSFLTSFGNSSTTQSSGTANNTAYGYNTLNSLASGGNRNTAIGSSALSTITTGDDSTAVGYNALNATTAGNNTALGSHAAENVSNGGNNTALGASALSTGTTVSDCTAVGANALGANTGVNNTAVGSQALTSNSSGTGNTGVGFSALNAISTNSNCTAVGYQALILNTSSQNTAVGSLALKTVVSSANNTAIGYNALTLATSANNTAVGAHALETLASSSGCTAVGASALQTCTGQQNTAIGQNAGDDLSTGTGNTLVGYAAGGDYASSESNNVVIGVNSGTVGESNVIRIGNTSNTTCFIRGINGVTVTGTAVLCSTAGQLGTISSSQRWKENIFDIKDDSSLIYNLRPVKFNYKKMKGVQWYGLIAEEVEKEFKELCIYDDEGQPDSVAYHMMPALMLNEIQRLNKRVSELERRLQ